MIKKTILFAFSLLVFCNIGFAENPFQIMEEIPFSKCVKKDPLTGKCVALFTREKEKIVERSFYDYDEQGQIVRIIFDDGIDEDPECYDEVTHRQIVVIQRNEFDSTEVTERMETTMFFDKEHNLVYRKEIVYDLKNKQETENYDFQMENGEWKHVYFQKKFNESGLLVTFIQEDDSEKHQTYYEYDSNGLLHKIIQPNGVAIHYHYNTNGLIDRLVAADGSVHCDFSYDLENHLFEVKNQKSFLCNPEGNLQFREWVDETKSSFYGGLSVDRLREKVKGVFESCLSYLKYCVEHIQEEINTEHDLLSHSIHEIADQLTQFVLGNYYTFLGKNIEPPEIGVFGEKEINPKIRITFINGMLTKKMMMKENLKIISGAHGETRVHYIYRNTEGWVWDSANALMIKVGYLFGYRSKYAHLLAQEWKDLIAEMGGVEGGGMILHYAHSLGGTDTDRARTLLTPEEQKMIRVITIGSPTFIRNQGFESVWNHTSVNDGVRLFAPLGHYRHYFSQNSNVRFHGLFKLWPLPLFDHMIDCATYRNLLTQLGEEFLQEFNLN